MSRNSARCPKNRPTSPLCFICSSARFSLVGCFFSIKNLLCSPSEALAGRVCSSPCAWVGKPVFFSSLDGQRDRSDIRRPHVPQMLSAHMRRCVVVERTRLGPGFVPYKVGRYATGCCRRRADCGLRCDECCIQVVVGCIWDLCHICCLVVFDCPVETSSSPLK